MPININDTHWCIIEADLLNGTFEIHNSMTTITSTGLDQTTTNAITALAMVRRRKISTTADSLQQVSVIATPQQTGNDCTICALTNALAIIQGRALPTAAQIRDIRARWIPALLIAAGDTITVGGRQQRSKLGVWEEGGQNEK